MASGPDFAAYVVDQFAQDCAVTCKKMFGEYGFYSGCTFFGMIGDNRLFLKPTDGGRAFIGAVVEAPAYPGSV